jgi:hypothetical protein
MIARGGGTPSGPLSAHEVADTAHAFAKAYTDEDDASLRRLLTPGVRRVGAADVQRGRAAVGAEYHRQFAADAIEAYTLSNLRSTGGTAGRAEGDYTVTRRDGAPITGHLVLGIVRRDGRARIDLIAPEPRAS